MKKVKATFTGTGSTHYVNGEDYTLILSRPRSENDIMIEDVRGGGKYEYHSIIAFLNNWDHIKTLPL